MSFPAPPSTSSLPEKAFTTSWAPFALIRSLPAVPEIVSVLSVPLITFLTSAIPRKLSVKIDPALTFTKMIF